MFGGGKGLERKEERKKEEINLKLPKIKGFASVFGGGGRGGCQASYIYLWDKFLENQIPKCSDSGRCDRGL